jgi:hypothetical protein
MIVSALPKKSNKLLRAFQSTVPYQTLIILHAEHLDLPRPDHVSPDTGHDIAMLMALFYKLCPFKLSRTLHEELAKNPERIFWPGLIISI